MKKIVIAGIFITAFALFTNAQTADEIISKHIAAMGGKEKMMSLKTLKMTGIATDLNRTEIAYVFIKKHLIGGRIDNTVNGTKSWSVITSKKGWSAIGNTAPTETLGDILIFGQTHLDLQGPFLNYNKRHI